MNLTEMREVVHPRALPSSLPIFKTATCYLSLEHWNSNEWLWGVVSVYVVLHWMGSLYGLAKEKHIDIFTLLRYGK